MSLWIKNANIATMDPDQPSAQSAVVIGDFFAFVGTDAGAEQYLREHPQAELETIDCGGSFLLPGFNDSHMHYLHYVKAKLGADLSGSTSLKEVIDRMRHFFEHDYKRESGLWCTGEGWNHDYFTDERRFPNSRDLDAITTEYPILIMRACFHVGVMNSKAMEILGLDKESVKKYGAYAETYEDGTPNGVVKEYVFDDIKKTLPAPSIRQLMDMLIESQNDMFAYGITSVQSDDIKYIPDGHAFEMLRLMRDESEKRNFKPFSESNPDCPEYFLELKHIFVVKMWSKNMPYLN